MALLTYRLTGKLRVHSKELQCITEDANERLSKYEEFNLSQFHNVTWALKESSTRLTRCLSLLDGVLLQIGRLGEKEWDKYDGDLIFAADELDAIELSARLALAVLEAKLKHMKDLWNMLPETDKVIPFRRFTDSSPTISPAKDDGKINVDTKLFEKKIVPSSDASSDSSSEDELVPAGEIEVLVRIESLYSSSEDDSEESESEDEPVSPRKMEVKSIKSSDSSLEDDSEDEPAFSWMRRGAATIKSEKATILEMLSDAMKES